MRECPWCSAAVRVVDVRSVIRGVTRRRKQCTRCKQRFTTYETLRFSFDVRNSHGRVEPFDRARLRRDIEMVSRGLVNHPELLDTLVTEIEAHQIFQGQTIESAELAGLVERKLLALDPVAFVRYAIGVRRCASARDVLAIVTEAIQSRLPPAPKGVHKHQPQRASASA